MVYGRFFALALAAAGILVLPSPQTSTPVASYDVLCVSQTLPGGRPLPEVCVPYPL